MREEALIISFLIYFILDICIFRSVKFFLIIQIRNPVQTGIRDG